MNPYQALPARAFWRPAVAEPAIEELRDLWVPKFPIGQDDPILTVGSCFAARIGESLIDLGMNFYDAEPAPPGLTREQRRARHYGEFSFRVGNVYTAAVLKQWLSWAFEVTTPPDTVWSENGRFFDPYRPSIDPDGHASAEDMLAAREITFDGIRRGMAKARCLVFTLGLTEAWTDTDGTVYPACPGTVRGTFDERRHRFHNYTFAEVCHHLGDIIELVRTINPDLRFVLTVSPVPLTATAAGQHVLVASTYSKSLLRAVAGQLAQEHDHVDYFPAYELITGQPVRSRFYEDSLRSVTPEGVSFVLKHFMAGLRPTPSPAEPVRRLTEGGDACDDAVLDYYSPR
ncbi:GSCFA domain-containing protein [Kutzneria sp. NPDC052558]|uniref:GSCFA domain-containing protein n=1 Tax=Kutzneria sp. NPDC052558 TaxID=3364121 RepID=UPI0037CC2644